MIPKDTIDEIFNTARIEEVVGDFVRLKKAGANYMGLCPFHDDRSPSMSVSSVKGIFKCFSCGASGNSVTFVMDHEQVSYPEALKILAKKYAIEVPEEKVSDEQKQKLNERESMLLVTEFAAKTFAEDLTQSDEGQSVGLAYFKNRGVNEVMLERFALGYAQEQRDYLTQKALHKGYKLSFLEKVGLSITKNTSFDRFAGRVIFPIHNISGRVIAFGGRTLSKEKKIAKYLNSPESEIYHKSKVLYGLYQAKKSIAKEDNCILVEGYTDVIALHQIGVENVVASSGTALSTDQIRLIKRFTNQITLALDGDAAGLKAALRGVDLILQEDMDILAVAFPKGEDPDSFSRSLPPQEVKAYLTSRAKDFISFKCEVLLKDAENDPIKKAQVIKEVISSIVLIPDSIKRDVYAKSAARLLAIDEKILLAELKKMRLAHIQKEAPPYAQNSPNNSAPPPEATTTQATPIPEAEAAAPQGVQLSAKEFYNEGNLIRVMVQHGYLPIYFEQENEDESYKITVLQYLINELEEDELHFLDPIYAKMFEEMVQLYQKDQVASERYFIQKQDRVIVERAIALFKENHQLSDGWKKNQIYVPTEVDQLKQSTQIILNRFKLDKVNNMIKEVQNQLESHPALTDELLMDLAKLYQVKKEISKILGRFMNV